MQGAGMIHFILLFGLTASGIWIWLCRNDTEKNIINYSLKSILFFYAGIYFVVSAIKLHLGEAQSTLSESFWDIEGRTYLHYGMILLPISIIVPLLMKWIFSSYGNRLIPVFDFIYVLILSAGLLLGRIDNRTYCVLYVVCLLIGIGISFLSPSVCSGTRTNQ